MESKLFKDNIWHSPLSLPKCRYNCIRHESEGPAGEDESTNMTQTVQAEERIVWLMEVNILS